MSAKLLLLVLILVAGIVSHTYKEVKGHHPIVLLFKEQLDGQKH